MQRENLRLKHFIIFLFENSKNIGTLQTRQMSQTVLPLSHATATNES